MESHIERNRKLEEERIAQIEKKKKRMQPKVQKSESVDEMETESTENESVHSESEPLESYQEELAKRKAALKQKRKERAENTKQLPGGGKVSEAYAFTGMHHIWDEHAEAGIYKKKF